MRRFGGVSAPPGRGRRQGPRGFHTLYVPGRACEQGPGRFGHVNVGGAGGLGRPASRVQRVSVPRGARACPRCARACLSRSQAVWPLDSGRVASGLSPRGVSSFVHARLGVRGNQGRMVSNLPSLCPHTCSRPPVVPHVPSPRRVEIAFLAGFVVLSLYWRCRATSHGGRAVASAPCGNHGCTLLFGLGGYRTGSSSCHPLTL